VSAFFRRAEEILEIATTGAAALGDTLMVLDRQGGFRMLNPEGWSLPALAAEFGAEAVYKVEHRGSSVRVEGWNGSERCLLQGQSSRRGQNSGDRMRSLLGLPSAPQTTMLNLTSLALA
jgi:hypothetical protein